MCNNVIVNKSSIFVLYITLLNLHENQLFENCISGVILPNIAVDRLYCHFCQQHSGDISMLEHFVAVPAFLIVELSSNCIDQIFFSFKYGRVRSTLCTQSSGSMYKSSFYSGCKRQH